LRTISHQLENLNKAIPELQAKVSKAETDISSLSNVQSSLVNRMSAKPDPFAIANAIQVGIDENIRLLAELHARWERDDEMAREMKVCTITTSNTLENLKNLTTMRFTWPAWCRRHLLLVVGDKVDDDLRLGLWRVDDHPVQVVLSTPAGRSARRRRHLLPQVEVAARPYAPLPFP
jgi:hypothetical protein